MTRGNIGTAALCRTPIHGGDSSCDGIDAIPALCKLIKRSIVRVTGPPVWERLECAPTIGVRPEGPRSLGLGIPNDGVGLGGLRGLIAGHSRELCTTVDMYTAVHLFDADGCICVGKVFASGREIVDVQCLVKDGAEEFADAQSIQHVAARKDPDGAEGDGGWEAIVQSDSVER